MSKLAAENTLTLYTKAGVRQIVFVFFLARKYVLPFCNRPTTPVT